MGISKRRQVAIYGSAKRLLLFMFMFMSNTKETSNCTADMI